MTTRLSIFETSDNVWNIRSLSEFFERQNESGTFSTSPSTLIAATPYEW